MEHQNVKPRSLNALALSYASDSSESDDSDFEFELNCRAKSSLSFYDDDDERPRPSRRRFDVEYYGLAPIEKVNLPTAMEGARLKVLGTVLNRIDFIVTVKANVNEPPLGLDTILFKKDGEILGSIFEVFGLVQAPLYALRFNTEEEAAVCTPDMLVYYCADDFEYTYRIFPNELNRLTIREEVQSDDEFSDDEAERVHNQKQRARARVFPTPPPVVPTKRVRSLLDV